MTLSDCLATFQTEADCRAYLERLRWPDGVRCPIETCKAKLVRSFMTVGKSRKPRHLYECRVCGEQFSLTRGTQLHDSHLPLRKWFIAVVLMLESRKGISANQVKRSLKTSYETAWYLTHRIREAMLSVDRAQLGASGGTVEVDETYYRAKPKRGFNAQHRMDAQFSIIGLVERGGELRYVSVPNTQKESVKATLDKWLAPDVKEIITDEAMVYHTALQSRWRPLHRTIQHQREFVRGRIHTNTIEGSFSLFKRGIVGTFHRLSYKHLDRYLAEFEFRYNNRSKDAYKSSLR